MKAKELIKKYEITGKPTSDGKEFLFEECPYCGGDKFYLNLEKGQYSCKKGKCLAKGNLVDLAKFLNEGNNKLKAPKSNMDFDEDDITEFMAELHGTDEYLEYETAYRKHTVETLKQLRWGYDSKGISEWTEEKYDQEILKDTKGWRVIPYYDEDGDLVYFQLKNPRHNKRNKKSGGKVKRYPTGTDVILYGIDELAKSDSDCCILFEGEDDRASYKDYGGKMPSGAIPGVDYSWRDEDLRILKKYKKVYLCFDSDEPGRDATFTAATLLGIKRCLDINLFPMKDLNDCRQGDMELNKDPVHKDIPCVMDYFAKAHTPDVPGMTIGDRDDEIAPQLEPPVSTGILAFDNNTEGGIRYGLTIISANGGIGKTTLSTQIAYNISMRGERVVYLPFESKTHRLKHRIAKMCVDEEEYVEAKKNIIYPSENSDLKFKSIEDFLIFLLGIKERYDVNFIMLDDLKHTFDFFNQGATDNQVEREGRLSRILAGFCYQHKIRMVTMHHNRKEQGLNSRTAKVKVPKPSLDELRGSGGIGDAAEAVIYMWRNKQAEDGVECEQDIFNSQHVCLLSWLKNRAVDNLGSIKLEYDSKTKRFKGVIG